MPTLCERFLRRWLLSLISLANGAEFGKGIATGEVTVNGHTQHGIMPRAGMQAQSQIQKAFGR